MSYEITLYKNSAEENRINKTPYLEYIGVIQGALRDSTSITDMTITIQQTEFPTFNYVYIAEFNRYYYVVDVTSIRTSIWEITLSVDVLMSYKNAILNVEGFIDRNEFDSNPQLVDKRRVIEQGVDVEDEVLEISEFKAPSVIDHQLQYRFTMNGYKLSVSNSPV